MPSASYRSSPVRAIFRGALKAVHAGLDPTSDMIARPSFPECPAQIARGTQNLISGDRDGKILFPGATVSADGYDRNGVAFHDRGMASPPSAVTAAISLSSETCDRNSGNNRLSPQCGSKWTRSPGHHLSACPRRCGACAIAVAAMGQACASAIPQRRGTSPRRGPLHGHASQSDVTSGD